MIKLKQEVNKSEIMRELKAEAEIAFENTWQKDIQIRAYMNGAHDLLKKLRISNVIPSVSTEEKNRIMADFDEDKYIGNLCRQKCGIIYESDYDGEPLCYGCKKLDARIQKMYDSILKRRLKKMRI